MSETGPVTITPSSGYDAGGVSEPKAKTMLPGDAGGTVESCRVNGPEITANAICEALRGAFPGTSFDTA